MLFPYRPFSVLIWCGYKTMSTKIATIVFFYSALLCSIFPPSKSIPFQRPSLLRCEKNSKYTIHALTKWKCGWYQWLWSWVQYLKRQRNCNLEFRLQEGVWALERSSGEPEREPDRRPTRSRPEGSCRFSPPPRSLPLLPPDGRGMERLRYQIGFAESQLQQCGSWV